MPQADKPRILAAMPTRGQCAIETRFSYYLATRGGCVIMPGFAKASLLGKSFNKPWFDALNFAEAGVIDYFLLHHDDVEPRTHGWLDILVAEQRRSGAAIICPTIAMKGPGQETTTAMHLRGTWRTRKLRIGETMALPETFCAADVNAYGIPGDLVINSGLLLVDLHRPEFFRTNERGEAEFLFTVQDRGVRGADGKFHEETWSEDWDFSARCNAAGLPVFATRKIEVIHHGGGEWSNQP